MLQSKNKVASLATVSIKKKRIGNLAIPILTVCIAAFGVLMVYSASFYTAQAEYGDAFFFMRKQLIGFCIGIPVMVGVAFIPYKKLQKLKWVALAVSVILLALVFVPGLGVTNYGATRWIGFAGMTIQPSEVAKYGFVIFTAAYVCKNPEKIKNFVGILPILGVGILLCVLIILEPNMSITMCMGMLMLSMLFLSGVRFKHFIFLMIPVIVAVPILIILEPYRLQRLYAFLDPWQSPQGEGYQLIQSLYALGNGGWFGKGLFHSMQKFKYLPFAESDFILSVIAEEFGFIGIVCLFLVFGGLIYAGIHTAAKCKDFFGFLLASGITAVYAIQVVINALVVSGAIPPTGLPLPLISSGNTSLIITMASMGVLYNISRGEKKKEVAV